MGIEFPYTVIRKPRRRSVTLTVSPENHLTLTVPKNFADSRIQEFLARQSLWIEKIIRRNQILQAHYPKKTYQSGDRFVYLGESYALDILKAEQRSISLHEGRLCVATDGEDTATVIRAWYEGMAYQVLKERVALFQAKMKVKAGKIRVRLLAGQWGSCAITGDLSFNARLVMAPMGVVDYVVVHELSHVLHHNHSPSFWKCVEGVIPDYRKCRKWLREHGQFLTL